MSRKHTRLAAAVVAAGLVLAGCGGSSQAGSVNKLEIMAPADPGGGWDQTARAMQAAITGADLVDSVQVSNVGGAGGTVGLQKLATEKSESYMMVTGLVMVGAVETNGADKRLEDTTPIARLTAEDEVVVVPAESPYQTIDDLLKAIEEQGKAISITGGSAGGTDHILAAMLLKAKNISSDKLNYVPYSGGGESLAALLGGQVTAGISGIGEYKEQIKAGKLRALGTSGPTPHPDLNAPTLKEVGTGVELINWRGVVAPGGISVAAKDELVKLVTQMHDSQAWKDELTKKGWTDTFLTGHEFSKFLTMEIGRIKPVLEEIGLVK
ncbi:Bug family tripartite tricarboxylate transporter substrate binding protein [Saccharothrix coeruleofusca]|uniref:C4-dicarboxylate ABC transporter substrate-binding protein n=1 Tax=Saccharothrix coeruleofusca TaxID=33919 RepID=A0A918EE74_9PSEU|nr:tripartite tricarboxylate transporter substrate binding protein [Saccharothrix coeruleofusca]MBP2336288.1 putative tricarboxylic transport membrane protein [Saccharothrix coeruleofusca]GGP54123.1 C4-dicarboxylate ABC transporter substrate-binding protein [Saccharothrix coeruleofusca]